MTDQCNCGTTAPSRESSSRQRQSRVLSGQSPLEAELPEAMQVSLGRLLDAERAATLSDWVDILHTRLDTDSIERDHLCHASETTGHWGQLDGERYDFLCFYDAVVLAAMADAPVDIHTESPDGTVVTAEAVGTADLTVTPEDAVFSFGVATDLDGPDDGDPTPADIYSAICPYVRAFPDRAAYEQWAEQTPAVTVALPLAGSTELAAALVE